jgi:hypothetical protein
VLPIQPLMTAIPQYVVANLNKNSGLGKKITSLRSFENKGKLGADFYSKSVLEKYCFDLTFTDFQDFQTSHQIIENKVFQKLKLPKDANSKNEFP